MLNNYIQLEVSSLNFIYNGLRKDYYLKNEDALLYTLRLK